LRLPLIQPDPPRLSDMADALRRVEASGVFSNGGPAVRAFEADIAARLFGGLGTCLATGNATVALMIALRDAVASWQARNLSGERPLALMTSFTFAAAAHAALWAGLTPLLCDCDADDWTVSAHEEERLLALHGDRIAVVVPYAAFGTDIDLDRYRALADRHGVAVVVDAAASLGTIDAKGRGFGTGCPFPVIFSMHATKPFGVAEGGVIHSTDADLVDRLRRMTNYGFGALRAAELPGLNAKLPEVIALMASAQLDCINRLAEHRAALHRAYRDELGDGFALQRPRARRQAMQFMPLLLPDHAAPRRAEIMAGLAAHGIGSGSYFNPHLAQQPHFARTCLIEPTPEADMLGTRMISLPVTDRMDEEDVREIAGHLQRLCARPALRSAVPASPVAASTLIVGGGPAGTALLIAAAREGRLEALARSGLVLVERSASIGDGALGGYAIPSDSSADTFLSAAHTDHHDLSALLDGESARIVAAHRDRLGVPLHLLGPFLRMVSGRLAEVVRAHGGSVLTGHDVHGAHRTPRGDWRVDLRRADGSRTAIVAGNLVVATGGEQPLSALQHEQVGGASLVGQAGYRLVQSDDLLATGGIDRVAARLDGRRAPRIVVVGGSTSALATVSLLLKAGLPLGGGAISLLHRRPLRPFYPSAEAAHEDGYDDFDAADICPVSGFVYRLGGFRLDARDLVLRMLGIGGREPDPRVALHRMAEGYDPDALALIARADLVVSALGYRPRALPLFGTDGRAIALQARAPGRMAMVDRHCRLLDGDGRPIPGAYGIGLAAGFVPGGALGGEPSFRGQANGLWLWQNDVGSLILDQLAEQAERAVA
jgi:dTDP-4-amino-4,6-dideoxygalactose transaminase